MRCPPKSSSLGCCTCGCREKELHEPTRLECAMRKVAVQKGRNGKHPREIQKHSHPNSEPTPPHPNHTQTAGVQKNERETPRNIQLSLRTGIVLRLKVRIKSVNGRLDVQFHLPANFVKKRYQVFGVKKVYFRQRGIMGLSRSTSSRTKRSPSTRGWQLGHLKPLGAPKSLDPKLFWNQVSQVFQARH